MQNARETTRSTKFRATFKSIGRCSDFEYDRDRRSEWPTGLRRENVTRKEHTKSRVHEDTTSRLD